MIKKFLIANSLAVILLLSFINVLAQSGKSTIGGTVTDLTGAVISGATVTVTKIGTGQKIETTSGENGSFLIQSLDPSIYKIEIKAAGFANLDIDNVLVRVGDPLNLINKLTPSTQEQVIEVNASDVQGVDTRTSQVSAYVSDSTLANLPLNGRNFIDLAFLLPGNSPGPIFDFTRANTIVISSAGQLGRGGNLSVDGADNNDDALGGILQNFPQDAVQEFQIITNQFSADIGRSGSSAINVVTKSGTNDFHGSFGFFFRNDSLSALPPTLDPQVVLANGEPPFDRQQYTTTFGGPIKRDKAWFFNAFEYRNQDAILIAGQRDLTQQRIVNTFANTPLNDALLSSRVDVQPTIKDRMSLRFSYQDLDAIGTAFLQRSQSSTTHLQNSENRYTSVSYNLVHTFSPNLLNDLVIQNNNYENKLTGVFNGTELLFPTLNDGSSFTNPQTVKQNRFQLRNNVSLIAGNHALKFGGEFHRIDGNISVDLFGKGNVILTEDFASQDRNGDRVINDLDIPIDVTLIGTTKKPPVELDNNYFAVYFQDSWKVKPNFTLNLGFRYEIESDSTNKSFFKNVNPILKPFLSGERDRDKDNIGPRIGFNYDPFSKGRTSIHGGYGIYYERVVGNSLEVERRNSGLNTIVQIRLGSELDDDGKFLPGTATLANPFTGIPLASNLFGLFVLDNTFEHPVIQQFNFGIRQEIFRDYIVSVDAIHTYGTKFVVSRPIGEVVTPDGPVGVQNIESSAKNFYDGLLINVEKRPSKGFGFLASYTLSKAFNYANDDQFVFVGTTAALIDPTNPALEKGPTPNDQRHRFTFSGVFDLPFFGIKLSPIFTLSSDVPFDIILPDGSSRIPLLQRNAGGRLFRKGSELNAFIKQINSGGGIDGVGPLPLVRDNLEFGDSFTSFDLRLMKSFKLSERVSLQATAEVFNLFNVTNIQGTSAVAFSGFQNVLARDSQDPNDPGFLRSSSFGSKLQNAGGVFGTGGPRAFQFAFRLSF